MELIYFGSFDSLADPDGDMRHLKSASMIDRYQFLYDKPSFHVVTDPTCATEYGLDPSKQNLLLFQNKDLKPEVLTGDPNDEAVGPLDIMTIMKWLNLSIIKAVPRWGERAHTVLFDFQQNGLIFMIPEVPNDDPRELMKDWKALTFNAIHEMTKEFETGMIPRMSTFEAHNVGGTPQLSEMLQVKKEDLPMFYTLHAKTDQSVAYPFPLDDPLDASPEMILLWSRREVLDMDIDSFEGIIKQIAEKEDLTDE